MFKIFTLKHHYSLRFWLRFLFEGAADYNMPSRCGPKPVSKMHKFRCTTLCRAFALLAWAGKHWKAQHAAHGAAQQRSHVLPVDATKSCIYVMLWHRSAVLAYTIKDTSEKTEVHYLLFSILGLLFLLSDRFTKFRFMLFTVRGLCDKPAVNRLLKRIAAHMSLTWLRR